MKWLLMRTLIGVFVCQGLLLAFAYYKCDKYEQCPNLGQRTEQLFSIATATILSLLSKTD